MITKLGKILNFLAKYSKEELFTLFFLVFCLSPIFSVTGETAETVEYLFGFEQDGELIKSATKGEFIEQPSHAEKAKPVLVVRNNQDETKRRISLRGKVDHMYAGKLSTARYPHIIIEDGDSNMFVVNAKTKEVVLRKVGRNVDISPNGQFLFYSIPVYMLRHSKEELKMIDISGENPKACKVLSPEIQGKIESKFYIANLSPWEWGSDHRFWGIFNYLGGNKNEKNFIYEINIHSCDNFDVQLTDITDQVRERYFDIYSHPDQDMDFYQIDFDPERSLKLTDGRYLIRGGLGGKRHKNFIFYTKNLAEVWQEYNQSFYWLYGTGLTVLAVLLIVSFWYPLWRALGILTTVYAATILGINYAFVSIYSNWGGRVGDQVLKQIINILG